MGTTLDLVEKGKGLIVLAYEPPNDNNQGYPGMGFVQVVKYSTPKDWVEYEIVSSPLTEGVHSISGSSISRFLSGGYPLLSPPKKAGYPTDASLSLIVYGHYGKGRYVILTPYLTGDWEGLRGDVGILLSNALHWVTGREIPPPPAISEVWAGMSQLNATLKQLQSQSIQIQRTLENLKIEDVNEKINSVKEDLNIIISDINDELSSVRNKIDQMSKEINDLKEQSRYINQVQWTQYASMLSIIMALIAIILARRK